MKVLEQRLTGRGTDAPEEVERRLETARIEIAALPEFDYAVFNDALEDCVASVLEIIARERAGEPEALARRFSPAAASGRFERARDGRPPGGGVG
jgi:guanylate kinase